MKTKYIALILVSIIGLNSCQKFIEVEPKQVLINDKAITTFKDLQSVLFGAYDGLQSGNVAGGNATFYADLMSDDAFPLSGKLVPFVTQEIYDGATSVQIGPLRDMWRDNYTAINRANVVIDVIDNNKLSGADFDNNKNKFKGEALFIRAYAHFNLLQFWALPYNVNNKGNNTQAGVVIRVTPTKEFADPNLMLARSPVEASYAQVINDLKEAEGLLAADVAIANQGRINKYAVQAILARVLLLSGDNSAASNYAQQVINSGNYTLANDSSKLWAMYQISGNNIVKDFTNNAGKPEVICQLVNILTDNVGNLDGYYSLNKFMTLNLTVATLYEPEDDRKTSLIRDFTNLFTKKYIRSTLTPTIPNNIILARLAEMYLIVAEADVLASNGVTTAARNAYNTLRKRNIGYGYIDETTIDKDDFLAKVRLERRLELLCENGDRYMTIRRLRLPLRDGSANYGKFLFKIPQEEIAGNPTIEQNP